MNRDELCPVRESLDFFNRKWVLCILMDMFGGCKHFTDFQQANSDLSNSVLSQTLKYMEDVGLIEKLEIDLKTRNKTEYKLTEKGLNANRILFELTRFSLEELESSKLDESMKNRMLIEYSDFLNI